MGRHVKLLKPEWSSILETSFGASLNAFVVKSQSDQSILSELMRRMNCQYPIFIGQDGHIDTTAHEPDPKLDTWMRVLAIDNNLVRNQLIINHGIEQVVLIPRKKEAEDLMHGPPSGRRNVRMCYFMAETDPTKGHVINVNQNSGAISLGPINPYRRKARMQADKEPQLRAARSNLDRLQRDLDAAVAEAKERQRHVESCERKLEEHGRLRRELVVRSQKAETIVEQLDLELSAAAPDSGMLEQLDESLREAEEEKAFEEGQMEDIIAEKRKLDEISREQKDSKAAMQGVIDQLRIELDKLERNAERLRHAREQALREKNAALDSVAAAERRRGEFEEKRVAKLRHLQDITSQAEQICARVAVPTGETFDSLNRKRERLARERVQSERE
jgi:chromosome segregation ATPase